MLPCFAFSFLHVTEFCTKHETHPTKSLFQSLCSQSFHMDTVGPWKNSASLPVHGRVAKTGVANKLMVPRKERGFPLATPAFLCRAKMGREG